MTVAAQRIDPSTSKLAEDAFVAELDRISVAAAEIHNGTLPEEERFQDTVRSRWVYGTHCPDDPGQHRLIIRWIIVGLESKGYINKPNKERGFDERTMLTSDAWFEDDLEQLLD